MGSQYSKRFKLRFERENNNNDSLFDQNLQKGDAVSLENIYQKKDQTKQEQENIAIKIREQNLKRWRKISSHFTEKNIETLLNTRSVTPKFKVEKVVNTLENRVDLKVEVLPFQT